MEVVQHHLSPLWDRFQAGSLYATIPDFPAASLTGPTDVAGVTNEIYLWLSVADTGLQIGDEYGGTYYVQIFKAGE